VAVTNFIATSDASLEALKTANLLKGLPINAFIFGQSGTGKKI
jgi:transcriptional regulator with PAS, ATPase and Fis domain